MTKEDRPILTAVLLTIFVVGAGLSLFAAIAASLEL